MPLRNHGHRLIRWFPLIYVLAKFHKLPALGSAFRWCLELEAFAYILPVLHWHQSMTHHTCTDGRWRTQPAAYECIYCLLEVAQTPNSVVIDVFISMDIIH